MNLKEIVGIEIAKRIKNNSTIGVGTGSTVEYAIKEIARRMREENLNIEVISSSYQSPMWLFLVSHTVSTTTSM